ncbi:MAG: GDP-mannose 4,6-dehydratase [Kofleriaceae bacterium]
MRYLITGCYGFVGGYLVRHLRETAPDVTIVALDRAAAPGDFPNVDASYELDLLDVTGVADILARERPDRIVHLASFSSVGFSWQDPVESFRNNTNIFLTLLEAVRHHAAGARILSVGSSEQYGVVEALPLVETSPLRPLSPYAVARVAQEHLGEVYVRGFGLDLVATRSFNHVGAGQSPQFVISALGKQFAELVRGRRDHIDVGTTSVVRDFLDVRDVVAAYTGLLDRGVRGEVYNVCSGHGTSIDGAIAMFVAIAGVTPRTVTDPARVRPVENEQVVGSHAKLTAAIGWRPTIALADSLRAIYDYWLARV